ncbi:hypothetical protein TCAL_15997, partial [Tigriopus californicus]
QTSVTEAPWNLEIQLDDHRVVKRVRCSCTAGGDGLCKHMSTLVGFIDSERTESSTDEVCKFRAPSQLGRQMYPKAKTADKIFKNPAPMGRISFRILESAKDKIHLDLSKIGDSESMIAILLKKRTDEFPTNAVWARRFSKNKAKQLCPMTLRQSSSALWRDERKICITSSQVHKIVFARTDSTCIKYFLSTKSLDGLEQIRYGRETEVVARQEFESTSGRKVHQAGLVIKLDYPWLGMAVKLKWLQDKSLKALRAVNFISQVLSSNLIILG